MLNMTSTTKVKVIHNFKKNPITKQLLTSILVDMGIYLPLKVIFASALWPLLISLFV